MNSVIGKLFVAIHENRVVVYDTVLSKFRKKLDKVEPGVRNIDWFQYNFDKGDIVKFTGSSGKEYVLQKVEV